MKKNIVIIWWICQAQDWLTFLKKNTEEVTCEYYFPNKKVVFGHFYVCCCICLEAYINKKNPLIILLCAKQYFCTVSVTVENRFIPTQLWLPNYHVAG
jgi:hypothetical protein